MNIKRTLLLPDSPYAFGAEAIFDWLHPWAELAALMPFRPTLDDGGPC